MNTDPQKEHYPNSSEGGQNAYVAGTGTKNRYSLYIIIGIFALTIVVTLFWGGIVLYRGRNQKSSTPETPEAPRDASSISTGSPKETFDKQGALNLIGYLDLFQSRGEFLESASIDYTLKGTIKEVRSEPFVIDNVTYSKGLVINSPSGQEQTVSFLQEDMEKAVIYSTLGGELKTLEFESLEPNGTVKILFSQNLLPKHPEKTYLQIIFFPNE